MGEITIEIETENGVIIREKTRYSGTANAADGRRIRTAKAVAGDKKTMRAAKAGGSTTGVAEVALRVEN